MATSTSDRASTAATVAYARGLERNLDATCTAIRDAQTRHTFMGRPRCAALAPRFIDGEAYDRICRVTELVARGLWQVARGHALRDRPDKAPYLQPADSAIWPLLCRFDGLESDDGFKLIELNTLDRGAVPWGSDAIDDLNALFWGLDAMAEVRRDFRIRPVSAMDCLARSVTHAHQGKAKPPLIALVDISPDHLRIPDWGLSEDPGLLIRMTAFLMTRGCRFIFCNARALTYEGGVLRGHGQAIDLVATAGGSPDNLEDGPGVLELGTQHPLLRALADRAVVACDAFPHGGLLSPKALFADLCDAAEAGSLEPEVAEAVRRAVPWTQRARRGQTRYQGDRRELTEVLREHREELVLKPSRGCGGAEVSLGWHCDAKEWERRVDAALRAGDYVVQQRVRTSTALIPVLGERGPEPRSLRSDFCPFIWADGSVDAVCTRLAEGDISNVSRGATDGAWFIVDGRRAS